MADKKTKIDPYMSKDDMRIAKIADEKYKEQVQDLLELIPTAPVFKQDLTTTVEGVVLPAFKYTIDNRYTIDSDLRRVFSIEADDVEVSRIRLKSADYKKIIAACEQRRAILLKEHLEFLKLRLLMKLLEN